MGGKEIKHEFGNYVHAQCRVCLSVGRKLFLLGQFVDIYKKLTSEIMNSTTIDLEAIQLCWECFSLLHKVVQFQNHVRKANELLHLGQSFICGTLSNLTTVITNDTHPNTIYVNEANIRTDIKPVYIEQQDLKSEESETNDPEEKHFTLLLGQSGNNDYENDDTINNEEIKIESTIQKKKHENKWAKRWALQNKKPKYKIIANNELNFDETFNKVHIDDNELRKCLERERDSEYFKSKRYKCDKCVVGFDDESALLVHNNSHEKIVGELICDICERRYTKKRHLSKHISKHYYIYKCKTCSYTCQGVNERRWHYQKEHNNVFKCLKCELTFGGRREFFKHFKEWHEKFICDHCGISFKMRYCIKDHIRKQHSPFECKECDKRFARYNGLWLHNKICHGPPSAPTAYCVECDKRYVDIYRYKWHLANSARHKPRKRVRVPCPGCDKYFSKKIYMKDHYNLVHLKFYKYRCEECDKNFTRNADLVKHNRRVHEGILPPKNKICYMCGKGFSTNKILTNHLRTHTGERPFACPTCGVRFAQSTSLHAHVRALHEKLPRNDT